MIIFPDNYTQPTGDGYTAGTYNTSSNFTTTVTSDYWSKMEQVGCVFLPLAGFREGIEINGGSANYWSVSTAVSGNAYKMGFQKSLVAVEYTSRYYGCSVRLVRDIK